MTKSKQTEVAQEQQEDTIKRKKSFMQRHMSGKVILPSVPALLESIRNFTFRKSPITVSSNSTNNSVGENTPRPSDLGVKSKDKPEFKKQVSEGTINAWADKLGANLTDRTDEYEKEDAAKRAERLKGADAETIAKKNAVDAAKAKIHGRVTLANVKASPFSNATVSSKELTISTDLRERSSGGGIGGR